MVIGSNISDNYLECKWIKCTNQKTLMKTCAIYVLPLTTSLCLIPKLYEIIL